MSMSIRSWMSLRIGQHELGATDAMQMITDSLRRRGYQSMPIDLIKETAVWMYVEKLAYEYYAEEIGLRLM